MFLRVFLLLTLVPILEIYFLIQLSGAIGGLNTFVLILSTGFWGAFLLKNQGSSILLEIQSRLAQNQWPSHTVLRGLFTFIGGLLLLTPGLLTDALGLSFILPYTQKFWIHYISEKYKEGQRNGSIHIVTEWRGFEKNQGSPFSNSRPSQKPRPFKSSSSTVIDVEPSQSQRIYKKK